MTRALVAVMAMLVAGVSAGAAQAGYRHWGYYDIYLEPIPCEFVVRRRGYPNATEYYFVERCLVPVEPRDRRRGRVLRSRG